MDSKSNTQTKKNCVIVSTGKSSNCIEDAIQPVIDIIQRDMIANAINSEGKTSDENIHIVLTPGSTQRLFTKVIGKRCGVKKCSVLKIADELPKVPITFDDIYGIHAPTVPVIPKEKNNNKIAVHSAILNCDPACRLLIIFVEEINEKIICECKKFEEWNCSFFDLNQEPAEAVNQ